MYVYTQVMYVYVDLLKFIYIFINKKTIKEKRKQECLSQSSVWGLRWWYYITNVSVSGTKVLRIASPQFSESRNKNKGKQKQINKRNLKLAWKAVSLSLTISQIKQVLRYIQESHIWWSLSNLHLFHSLICKNDSSLIQIWNFILNLLPLGDCYSFISIGSV